MSQNTTAMQRGAGGETTGATDMTTRQPEALDLADWLIGVGGGPSAQRAAALLRSQHARITELEAQLEAVGAGGVGPLIACAGFSAADMATAAAQGFRDGAAATARPVAEPADTVVLNAAMRAIQQAIELIGAPTDERMRAVRRVLRGAVIVAEDDGKVAPLPSAASSRASQEQQRR